MHDIVMAGKEPSWREQLNSLRGQIAEAEKQREIRKKLEMERNKEALSARLRRDTPQALQAEYNRLRETCQRIARRLYPPDALRAQLDAIAELGERLRFYRECQKDYGDLFSAEMRQTLMRLLSDLGELQRGMDRQLGQWAPVETILRATAWRPPQPADARRLVEISKVYNEKAFSLTLSLPGDFYAEESQNFFVAEHGGNAYGFVKYWPADDAITFAVVPLGEVNFRKFIRGFVHCFYTSGHIQPRAPVVRVRLSHPAEFRFFADMGFARAESKSLTDSIYQRELD